MGRHIIEEILLMDVQIVILGLQEVSYNTAVENEDCVGLFHMACSRPSVMAIKL